MLNLKDSKISYLLASANNINGLISYLYSRDYHLIDLKGYYKGNFENSVIAFTNLSNDELRKDALHILKHFEQECLILKYRGETLAKKVFADGQEKPLGVLLYNTDSENKSYIHGGVSFSFVEQQLYYFPKKKEDFKVGMLVELFTNNKWVEKKIVNPDEEFNKIYNLMMKYGKVRILL